MLMMNATEPLPGYSPKEADAMVSPEPRHYQRFLPEENEDEEPSVPALSPQLSPDAELPPAYTAHNENVAAFSLEFPFIYATSPAVIPRYQLFAEYSRTGKPQKLQIRRLLINESRKMSSASRRLSTVSATSAKSKASESLEYDEDTTLYVIQNEMIRGRRARTLPGHVQIDRGFGKCLFWHMTRNEEGDALRKENEKKIQKYGYHSKDEWHKNFLYEVQKSKWRDKDGTVVANEDSDSLEIVKWLDVSERDMLVTCWASTRWYADYKSFRDTQSSV